MKRINSFLFDHGPVRAAIGGLLGVILFGAALVGIILAAIHAPKALVIGVWATIILGQGIWLGLDIRKSRREHRAWQEKWSRLSA